MFRMLLVNGNVVSSPVELRRRLLRFTGSRRATRMIMQRITAAQEAGRLAGCLVKSTQSRQEPGEALGWEVGVTYVNEHSPA